MCVLVAQLCPTLQTVACQAPLSIELLGKDTGVGCHSLLQGIFPTQGSNPGLLDCRQILYRLSHQGLHSETKQLQRNVLLSTTLEETA